MPWVHCYNLLWKTPVHQSFSLNYSSFRRPNSTSSEDWAPIFPSDIGDLSHYCPDSDIPASPFLLLSFSSWLGRYHVISWAISIDPFSFFNVLCHSLMMRPFTDPLIYVTRHTASLPFSPFLLDSIRDTAIPQTPVYILTSVFPRLLSFFSSHFFYASTRHLLSSPYLVTSCTSLACLLPLCNLSAVCWESRDPHLSWLFVESLVLVPSRPTTDSLVLVLDRPFAEPLVNADRLSTSSSLVIVGRSSTPLVPSHRRPFVDLLDLSYHRLFVNSSDSLSSSTVCRSSSS